jgi:hypothetical protein
MYGYFRQKSTLLFFAFSFFSKKGGSYEEKFIAKKECLCKINLIGCKGQTNPVCSFIPMQTAAAY